MFLILGLEKHWLPAPRSRLARVDDRVQQGRLARAAWPLDAHGGAARLAQPAQQRRHLLLAADEAAVLGQRAIRLQRAVDDLGPEVLGEGAYGGAAVAIEGRFVARQLLPAALADDVIAQRGVQLFRLAQLGAIQRRLGQVEANWCGPKPAVDEGFDRGAGSDCPGLAEDARQATASGQARLAARGERREQLAHGVGEGRVHRRHCLTPESFSLSLWEFLP